MTRVTEYIVKYSTIYHDILDANTRHYLEMSFSKLSDATQAILDVLQAIENGEDVEGLLRQYNKAHKGRLMVFDRTVYQRTTIINETTVALVALPGAP